MSPRAKLVVRAPAGTAPLRDRARCRRRSPAARRLAAPDGLAQVRRPSSPLAAQAAARPPAIPRIEEERRQPAADLPGPWGEARRPTPAGPTRHRALALGGDALSHRPGRDPWLRCSSAPSTLRAGDRYDGLHDTTPLHLRRSRSIRGRDGRRAGRARLLPPGSQGRMPSSASDIEKVQVAALAERLDDLLDAVDAPDRGTGRRRARARGAGRRAVPRRRHGAGLGRGHASAVVIEAQTPTEDGEYVELPDDAEDGPDLLRVRIDAPDARGFVRRAEAARRPPAARPAPSAASRSSPQGHFCSRGDGKRQLSVTVGATLDPPLRVDWLDAEDFARRAPRPAGPDLPARQARRVVAVSRARLPPRARPRPRDACASADVRLLLLLVEDHELARWGEPDDRGSRAARPASTIVRRPIPDGAAPTERSTRWTRWSGRSRTARDGGRHGRRVHGRRRSNRALVAACALVSAGRPRRDAIARVRAVRHPTAVETPEQVTFVQALRTSHCRAWSVVGYGCRRERAMGLQALLRGQRRDESRLPPLRSDSRCRVDRCRPDHVGCVAAAGGAAGGERRGGLLRQLLRFWWIPAAAIALAVGYFTRPSAGTMARSRPPATSRSPTFGSGTASTQRSSASEMPRVERRRRRAVRRAAHLRGLRGRRLQRLGLSRDAGRVRGCLHRGLRATRSRPTSGSRTRTRRSMASTITPTEDGWN